MISSVLSVECSVFQERLVICTKFTVFAEKKGNCDDKRVNADNKKHNHKNNNNKTLNNFEILCQQTWLNRLCHTFDAKRVIFNGNGTGTGIGNVAMRLLILFRFASTLDRFAGWLTACDCTVDAFVMPISPNT